MLVLSRKPKETLLIGDNIRIVVKQIKGGRVTLAVAAPKEVKVVRGELSNSISQRKVA